MPMQYQSSKWKQSQGARSLTSVPLHRDQHNKQDAMKMLIRRAPASQKALWCLLRVSWGFARFAIAGNQQGESAGKPASILCWVSMPLKVSSSPGNAQARECPAHLSLPTAGAVTPALLPLTLPSLSGQTQERITLASFWEALNRLHGGERLLLTDTNPLPSTGTKWVLHQSSCFLHGKQFPEQPTC